MEGDLEQTEDIFHGAHFWPVEFIGMRLMASNLNAFIISSDKRIDLQLSAAFVFRHSLPPNFSCKTKWQNCVTVTCLWAPQKDLVGSHKEHSEVGLA